MQVKQQFRTIFLLILVGTLVGCNTSPKSNSNYPEANKKVDYKLASNLNVELGLGYLAQGQVSRAKQKLMHALELQPKNPKVHNALGYFWDTVGDKLEAEKSYKQAIKLSSSGDILNDYATFLCRQKRYTEAEQVFLRAINDKKYSGTAEVYENAGICAWQNAEEEKAIQYLETSLMRDPHRYDALLSLVEIHLKKAQYVVAKDYMQRFNNSTKSTAYSLLLEIKLAEHMHDMQTAQEKFALLKKMFPSSNEYHEYLRNKNG